MITILLALSLTMVDDSPLILGEGSHRYEWTHGWPSVEDGEEIGATHGDIAFDAEGNVYYTSDETPAIRVVTEGGALVRGFGEHLEGGAHGIHIAWEGERQVLLVAHIKLHQVLKMTLDGEVLWHKGPPPGEGPYQNADQFRPTGVVAGPDGRVYVADGYGMSLIHILSSEGEYLKSVGGIGTDPGRFRVCHGLTVDYRGDEPTLLVADRENGRLQRLTLDGEFIEALAEGKLRRPCKVVQRDDYLLIPDLAGRVTILDRDNEVVCHLGDNADPKLRATYDVGRDRWRDGEFISPHSAAWDADGDLYVMDWNRLGRLTRLERVRE